jgi:hypothetical protein
LLLLDAGVNLWRPSRLNDEDPEMANWDFGVELLLLVVFESVVFDLWRSSFAVEVPRRRKRLGGTGGGTAPEFIPRLLPIVACMGECKCICVSKVGSATSEVQTLISMLCVGSWRLHKGAVVDYQTINEPTKILIFISVYAHTPAHIPLPIHNSKQTNKQTHIHTEYKQ